jgi:hypothetical protein
MWACTYIRTCCSVDPRVRLDRLLVWWDCLVCWVTPTTRVAPRLDSAWSGRMCERVACTHPDDIFAFGMLPKGHDCSLSLLIRRDQFKFELLINVLCINCILYTNSGIIAVISLFSPGVISLSFIYRLKHANFCTSLHLIISQSFTVKYSKLDIHARIHTYIVCISNRVFRVHYFEAFQGE